MKTKASAIDYGIYIDRKKAFIVSLNHTVQEIFISEFREENKEIIPRTDKINEQERVQNKEQETFKKFCKSIIEKVIDANNIIIFGPSTNKYDLQAAIRSTKRLKNIKIQLLPTDIINQAAAVQFTKDQYDPSKHQIER